MCSGLKKLNLEPDFIALVTSILYENTFSSVLFEIPCTLALSEVIHSVICMHRAAKSAIPKIASFYRIKRE